MSKQANSPAWRANMECMILLCLGNHGPLTPNEVAEKTGVLLTLLRPRFSDMARRGVIEDTGERRSPAGCGRPQKVWSLSAEVRREYYD